VRPEELDKLKKCIHLIRPQTCDLPACSIKALCYKLEGRGLKIIGSNLSIINGCKNCGVKGINTVFTQMED
jgi:hypothetical protein